VQDHSMIGMRGAEAIRTWCGVLRQQVGSGGSTPKTRKERNEGGRKEQLGAGQGRNSHFSAYAATAYMMV